MTNVVNENPNFHDNEEVWIPEAINIGYFIVVESQYNQVIHPLEEWMRGCGIDVLSHNQVEVIFNGIIQHMSMHYFNKNDQIFSSENCRTISLIKVIKLQDSQICTTHVLKTFYPKINQKMLELMQPSNQEEK